MRRYTRSLELESRAEGMSRISGYGAVYYDPNDAGTEFELMPGSVERIMPGSFDRPIREDDIRSFFNHDENFVLGRNTANTLQLSSDSRGLRYAVDPPDTQTVRDLVIGPIRRGDVDGSSFMFRVEPGDARWEEEERNGESLWVRNIEQFSRVLEVGPVTLPAYQSATAGLRSEEIRSVQEELASAKLSLAETQRRKRRARHERRLRAISLEG